MKKDIHPENYRLVVFKDMSNEHSFIGKSTAKTSETVKFEDGNEYPLIKLEISNKSHPYFTGKMQIRRLKEECRKKWKKGFSERRFHDEFLAVGSLPVIYARAKMLGERLPDLD